MLEGQVVVAKVHQRCREERIYWRQGAWGNRIFIRNSDYLWCIGDPQREWMPPERYMER